MQICWFNLAAILFCLKSFSGGGFSVGKFLVLTGGLDVIFSVE